MAPPAWGLAKAEEDGDWLRLSLLLAKQLGDVASAFRIHKLLYLAIASLILSENTQPSFQCLFVLALARRAARLELSDYLVLLVFLPLSSLAVNVCLTATACFKIEEFRPIIYHFKVAFIFGLLFSIEDHHEPVYRQEFG